MLAAGASTTTTMLAPIPGIAVASYTSNTPQDDIHNHVEAYALLRLLTFCFGPSKDRLSGSFRDATDSFHWSQAPAQSEHLPDSMMTTLHVENMGALQVVDEWVCWHGLRDPNQRRAGPVCKEKIEGSRAIAASLAITSWGAKLSI